MWTLLFLCSVVTTHGVEGFDSGPSGGVDTQKPDVSADSGKSLTDRPSCLYNCGYHLGSCSCYSDCQYYGTCCHDYHYYCPSSTTEPGTTAYETPQPSCRYNCGNHLGSCSCSSSCQYYGTCCHDYHYYCPTSTPQPETTSDSTPRPSCLYYCGYHLGSCSCYSDCQYYGTCCHDYHYYCPTNRPTSEPVPTTARPSCRYNCGYHLGSCSCHSDCQYYDACCHDYHYYCPTSTPQPETTTDSTHWPSCHYNCGYHLGSCSCYSDCQYNGTCCHDYHSYCSSATGRPPTGQPCGGALLGSGIFSSPNYPYYYDNNAHCTWQLRASPHHTVFLAFTSMQLGSCCFCDFIEVFDGPSTHYPYLGKICNQTLTSFSSSSSYLTVRFMTDGSVSDKGFQAEFLSTLPPNSGQVKCSSDKMAIEIEKSYLASLGYNGSDLYLNDQYCRPTFHFYKVVFTFPIHSCGNNKEFENGKVVYTNSLRAYNSTSGEITREHTHLKLNIYCIMDEDSVSQNMFVVQYPGNSTIIGHGKFNTNMTFYTSSSFYFPVTEYPHEIELNENLYVEVNLQGGDGSLVIFLDTCVASPSSTDFHTRAHYLVRNGCPADDTYYAYVTGTQDYARFRVKTFQFLRASESVYLQCKVVICRASDSNSRCSRGCRRRKARGLASEHDRQTLVLGPIKLRDPMQKEE